MSKPIKNKCKIAKRKNIFNSSLIDKTVTTHQSLIKLYLSYAYSNKITKYTVKTPIINPNRICLNDILTKLTKSIPFISYSISYNATGDEIFIYCGVYPLTELILCEFTSSKSLWVKLRKNINDSHRLKLDLLEEEDKRNIRINENKKTTHYYINRMSRRNNERVIGDIINKVYLWKQLSKGVINSKGILVKLTLDEAAEYTEIKKKSLIDYQQQLKLGRLLGFDFNKHSNEKVNVLRGYVKNQLKLFELFSTEKLNSRKKLEFIIEADKLSAVEKQDEEVSL